MVNEIWKRLGLPVDCGYRLVCLLPKFNSDGQLDFDEFRQRTEQVAQLISAAPDMLSALEVVVNYLEVVDQHGVNPGQAPVPCCVKRAIAKAKGEDDGSLS